MSVERKTWPEIEQAVRGWNSKLADAIAASLPGRNAPHFWILSYDYGADIVHDSQFRFPKGASEPENFAPSFKPIGVPLALVLERAVEIYARGVSSFTAPLRILHPGELFGAFEATDWLLTNRTTSVSSYSISSGFRSIWIACNLGRKEMLHARWKPDENRSHFDVVLSLIRSGSVLPWSCRVLCVPYELLKTDGRPSELGAYVIRTAWLQSTVHRQQFALDRRIADLCALERTSTGRRDWLSYSEVVKHITSVARGLAPAHRASLAPDDLGGPFSAVQKKLEELSSRLHHGRDGKQQSDTPRPYVMQPTQLQRKGDFAFYSFCDKVPGLPLGVRLPKYGPEQARQVCALLTANEKPAELPQEIFLATSLGLQATLKFYCRGRFGKEDTGRGGQPFPKHIDLSLKDFLNTRPSPQVRGIKTAKLLSDDAFLLSCVRIKRDA